MAQKTFVKVNGEFVPLSTLECINRDVCTVCYEPFVSGVECTILFHIFDAECVNFDHGFDIHFSCFEELVNRIRGTRPKPLEKF